MAKLKKLEVINKGLTVKAAAEAHAALQLLLESDKENKFIFASATRCKLALNLRKTKPVADQFTEEQNRLVKQYGEPVLKPNPEGGDPIVTDNMQIKADSPNWPKFRDEFETMLASDSEVVLSPMKAYELAGIPEDKFNDPNAEPSKQNQIPTAVYSVLYATGVLTE